MKTLNQKIDLLWCWLKLLFFDCLYAITAPSEWKALRTQSKSVYDHIRGVYRIVNAVDVIRKLSADEMIDVMNNVLPKDVIDLINE